ncbi:MAG: hypothetical protein U5K81_15650 [Trueperaceae bacterium]|nr:hypothetical protein [Trueperaceae bacterium]
MEASNIVGVVVLIVVIYVAFRVGAFLMKGLLGLLAIGLIVWLAMSLFGGGDVTLSGMVIPLA